MSKPIIKEKPATYADLEALPPTVVGEILNGALRTRPCLPPRLGVAANTLLAELSGAFAPSEVDKRRWVFIYRPEFHFGSHVVVPDLAGWRIERLTPFPETAYFETPPDWVAQVLSPSTQAIDRTDKLSIYAETGVSHCWYIDPIAKTLEVMALTGGRWLLVSALKDDAPVNAPPFEAHTFPLSVLWAP